MTAGEERASGKAWPWGAQFIVILCVLAVALVVILLPVLSVMSAGPEASGLDAWGPILATLVSLTTMTVSGIFVFVAFRIDRGVKHETREEVSSYMEKLMKSTIESQIEKARDLLDKSFRSAQREMEKVAEDLTDTTDFVKAHVKEVEKHVQAADQRLAKSAEVLALLLNRTQEDVETKVPDVKTMIREMAIEELLYRIDEKGQRERTSASDRPGGESTKEGDDGPPANSDANGSDDSGQGSTGEGGGDGSKD